MSFFRRGLSRQRRAFLCALMALSVLIASLALGLAASAQSLAPQVLPPAMSVARSGHTATLLPDGRVLVVGGNSSITTSEIYDPALNEWTIAGNLSTARVGHTATLLPNGQVLVLGDTYSGRSKSADLFDPATGHWKLSGELHISRAAHSATLLKNGEVLVAGGDYTFTIAELYTSATDQWRDTGNLSTVRLRHTATLLPDGRVLVAGGSIAGLMTAEVYNPTTGEWRTTGAMKYRREAHTATLLPDGRVLVAGALPYYISPYPGPLNPSSIASTEIYSSTTNSWTSGAPMTVPRWAHTATLLPDGRVIMIGGYSEYGQVQSSVEIFDPASNRWYAARPLASPRASHTATLLADGTILVVGGIGAGGLLDTAERYDPRDALLGIQRYLPWFIYNAVPHFPPTAPPLFATPTPSP
jgi:Galactose oxidase, central domain